MVILLNVFYQHVVHIDLNVSLDLMREHLVHQPLIYGSRILDSKWHYFVAEETLVSDEQSLLLISLG